MTTNTQPGELRRVVLGSVAFFLIMCSYYILRPVRDEMGVQTGASKLQWLFTGTFIVTLLIVPIFGALVRRVARRRVLPYVYGFFVLNLAIFLWMFVAGITRVEAAAFFIWVSVINLFIVSLFWSSVSDVFTTEQSHRVYGYIAAGGSAGALTGPALTAVIAKHVPTAALLAISALLLASAALCVVFFRRGAPEATSERPIGGSILAGIKLAFTIPNLRGIAILIICYTSIATVLYVEQADVVGKTMSASGERTSFFASIDLIINGSALILQILATRSVVRSFGLRIALAIGPFLVLCGLLIAGVWKTAFILAIIQIVNRVGDFSLTRPGREMIYTTVDPESRYKAKNFIDTTIYRANDAAASWLVAAIRAAGLNSIILFAIPAALIWLITGVRIGTRHDRHQPA